jgi:IS5 family transposase
MKTDGHLGGCHLKGRERHAANVVLTAIGHYLRLVLAWLRLLLRLILLALCRALALSHRHSNGLPDGRPFIRAR